jgi:hypothetical protein
MAAVVQPVSIFTSSAYQQIYSDPFLNDIGYAVTRSISAFRDDANRPQPLVIGATSNLSLETANNMNLFAGMSNSFLYYQTTMNGSTRVDRQVLNVNANLTQTIFNYPQDVIIQSTSGNNPQATLQDVTFSRNNSNTLVDTTQSNFYFTKNITAAQNMQVGQNMYVNGSIFGCNLNVWLDKVNTPYSRIGYGFRINSNDQLELIKYAKYGSGDVLKKVAIFGTNPVGSNDRSDSSNYLVFNSLGTFGVGNSSNNSFTPLNSYGTSVNPLSNLFTQALSMSNVTNMNSAAIQFFQPSIYAQGIIYTSNDVNVGGSLSVANNVSIGGSLVGNTLSANSNLFVIGNVGIGTNSPAYKLHVIGDVFATDFKASSDRRLKKDFEVIGGALDKIRQISGYTFSRVEGTEKRFAGVIAQEMQAVLPEVVDTDTEGFLNVSYGNIAALLIQGVKELDEKITKLIG